MQRNNDHKTLLVIRSSAMGDVAMTAPVVRELTVKYPDLQVIMLTRDFYEPFFDGIRNITIHNIDLADTHHGVQGVYRLFRELQSTYKIDFIVDLNDKLYSKLLRKFFKYSGVRSTHIDKGRKEKKMLTARTAKRFVQLKTSIDRYADAFRKAGYDIETPVTIGSRALGSTPWPHQLNELREVPCVGLAPFAKHKGKVLPLDTVRDFIKLMSEKHPDVRILIFGGGSAERMIADSLTSWFPNCVSVVSKLTLRDEMNTMANLKVMVSMDSSAMHMCSLMGTPVVSVWGATHPYAGFLGLGQSPNDVVQIEDLLCRPCSVYGHKTCFRGDYACLTGIKATDILTKIEKYL